jgi:hypothetical protein
VYPSSLPAPRERGAVSGEWSTGVASTGEKEIVVRVKIRPITKKVIRNKRCVVFNIKGLLLWRKDRGMIKDVAREQ